MLKLGAFLNEVSENYLGAIAKQYVDHVIVENEWLSYIKEGNKGGTTGKQPPSLLNKMII